MSESKTNYERIAFVDQCHRDIELITEEQNSLARMRKIIYDSHIDAGFTSDQSMFLLIQLSGGGK